MGEVPAHLRDASYGAAGKLGHGTGYRYPHDHPNAWVAQQYLPDELAGSTYYRAGDQGAEARLVARWRERRGEIRAPGASVEETGG